MFRQFKNLAINNRTISPAPNLQIQKQNRKTNKHIGAW